MLGRIFIAAGCAVVVLLTAWLDWKAGEELSLYVFYSVPIFVSCWYIGPKWAIFVSLMSAAAWSVTDYHSHPSLYRVLVYWNGLIRAGFFVCIAWILTALKRSYESEKKSGHIDFLTGLANRRAFFEYGEREINRCRRTGFPLTLALMDLDQFKAVNDRLGHLVGDDLLRTVATVLKSKTRKTDIVARLGGDEFAVLLTDAGEPVAFRILEKLQLDLCKTVAERNWDVTLSIGMVTYSTPPGSLDSALLESDRLMYRAKNQGRNQILHKMFGSMNPADL